MEHRLSEVCGERGERRRAVPGAGRLVSARLEELAWADTPMGVISLRRRVDPMLKVEVYEAKLGEEFLMLSLFTVAETELARLAMSRVEAEVVDVVVGGLGLGYTARAALSDQRVRSLTVVEALAEVIDWHDRGLVPGASELIADPRTRLVHGDFFAMVDSDTGFDPQVPGRRVDAILLDIDHTPRHVLHPRHASFYTAIGIGRLARHLRPGGVFALWSDDPPDEAFLAVISQVFPHAAAQVVTFANPLTRGESANTIYLAW
jgi:spermidine synthase